MSMPLHVLLLAVLFNWSVCSRETSQVEFGTMPSIIALNCKVQVIMLHQFCDECSVMSVHLTKPWSDTLPTAAPIPIFKLSWLRVPIQVRT